jgi:restriction alleviation protein Lar
MSDMTELYYAEMESARNIAEDEFFEARPHVMRDPRAESIYRAAFERGFREHWGDKAIDRWNDVSADGELKLKPCPFCDSEAKIENAAEVGPNSYVVACQNPQCMSSSQVRVADKDDVTRLLTEAWNRRGDKIRAQYAECSPDNGNG